jgi:hypothetical protein
MKVFYYRFFNNNEGIKADRITKAICNKGFIGNSFVVSRSNFRVGRQKTAPQSLTAHTLVRYRQY